MAGKIKTARKYDVKKAVENIKPKNPRNAARTSKTMAKGNLRLGPSAVKYFTKEGKELKKSGSANVQTKFTSSTMRVTKTNSPRKASVAGVANKVKAQGGKMNSTPSARMNKGRKGR